MNTATKEIIRLRERGQIVIPQAVRKEAHCETGDLLEAIVKDDTIILRPVKTIPRDQAWFWSEKWQKKEKEADQAIAKGDVVGPFSNSHDALKALKKTK